MAAGSTFVRVFLTENDVPGAKFCYNSVEEHTIVQLRRWLECRGLQTAGTKAILIERPTGTDFRPIYGPYIYIYIYIYIYTLYIYI